MRYQEETCLAYPPLVVDNSPPWTFSLCLSMSLSLSTTNSITTIPDHPFHPNYTLSFLPQPYRRLPRGSVFVYLASISYTRGVEERGKGGSREPTVLKINSRSSFIVRHPLSLSPPYPLLAFDEVLPPPVFPPPSRLVRAFVSCHRGETRRGCIDIP